MSNKLQEALGKLQSSTGRRGAKSDMGSTKPHGGHPSTIGVGEPPQTTDRSGPDVKIDFEALRAESLIPPEHHERELAGQYREIKRPLIANAFGKRVTAVDDGQLISVTCAIQGEGKTFTCINLAMSIAQERDYSVLLVDADVAKPQLSEVFGLGKELGLLDLLEDHSLAPENVISQTDISGFNLLPAGRPRQNATELLSSRRMEVIIRQMCDADERRVMLFDTSPLLRTTEAKVITSLVGQVVFVVKSESTPQGAVVSALQMLSPEQAVNLVLNQSLSNSTDYGYGYRYSYASSPFTQSASTHEGYSAGGQHSKTRGLWE